jgi:hypothetical protein
MILSISGTQGQIIASEHTAGVLCLLFKFGDFMLLSLKHGPCSYLFDQNSMENGRERLILLSGRARENHFVRLDRGRNTTYT